MRTNIRGRSRRLPSPEALSTTQAVVLQTMNEPLMEQGWGYMQLRLEIPGVRFNVNTLVRLVDFGLIDRPSKECDGWKITDTGRLLVAEMEMNADSRIGRPGASGFSWERRTRRVG